jgi:hypothetical protein
MVRKVAVSGLAARGERPWNRSASDDLRAAFAAGLDHFQNQEPGVAIDWDVGRLTRSDPPGFVSLAALVTEVTKDPEALLRLPDETVRLALERLWAENSRGVMRLDEDWYEPVIDELSSDRFAETAYDVLVSTLSPGLVTHAFDPLRGAMTLGVEPPETATHDSRVPSNELWVSLGALLGLAHRARSAGDTRALADILREKLEQLVRDDSEGVTWLLGHASRDQKAVALACMQRRS